MDVLLSDNFRWTDVAIFKEALTRATVQNVMSQSPATLVWKYRKSIIEIVLLSSLEYSWKSGFSVGVAQW
jgi:hypothetical protein